MPWTIPNEADATNVAQARLFSSALADLISALSGQGVVSGCAVAFSSGMGLTVASGTLQLSDGSTQSVAGGALTVTAADGTYPRFDIVEADLTTGAISVKVGVAAEYPVEPSTTSNRVKLCQVYVAAGAVALGHSVVIDRRIVVARSLLHGTGAGGVLSGSFPSPGFAVDMATQSELNTVANDLDTLSGDVELIANKGQPDGYASLDAGGRVPEAQLPAIAITSVMEVSSQVSMLALNAQEGDVAVRSDLNKSFILSSGSPSLLASWVELRTPTDAVLSVMGMTGAVSGLLVASNNLSDVPSASTARNNLGAAATSHNHSAADLVSGTVDIARLPIGTSSTTVAVGNDSRLSDARTPTSHKSSHATGGSDPLAPSDIGAVATTRTVNGVALSADRAFSSGHLMFDAGEDFWVPLFAQTAGLSTLTWGSTVSNAMSAGVLWMPMYWPVRRGIKGLAIEIVAANAGASAALRLVVAASTGVGRPGTIVGQGTVSITTTGTKEITWTEAVTDPGWLFVGSRVEGLDTGGTNPTYRGLTISTPQAPQSTIPSGTNQATSLATTGSSTSAVSDSPTITVSSLGSITRPAFWMKVGAA